MGLVRFRFCLLTCAAFFACGSASAQIFSQQGNELAVSGTPSGYYNVALAANGGTAVVGTPTASNSTGGVYILTRDGSGNWSQQGNELVGSGAVGTAYEGWSVAVSADGNTLVTGGPLDNNAIGAVWIFTRDGNGNWTQQGNKLVGTGAANAASQGRSVAISADGNTVLVGGESDNSNLGAAWVFTRDNNGNWTQQGSKLVGTGSVPDTNGNVLQGWSVALSGDGNTALLGGPADNGDAGAVWVFTRDNSGNWTQQGSKLVGTGTVGTAAQGYSVALSSDGNTALVGGTNDNRGAGQPQGAAWVFTRDTNNNWSQQGSKLFGTGVTGYAEQGYSVALSGNGNTAVLGGPQDNSGVGAAWVFNRNRNGNWTQLGSKLVGSGGTAGLTQGYSVAISSDGNTAMLGTGASGNGVWAFLRPHNLLFQNDSTRQVTSWFLGGSQGAVYQGQTSVASTPGWSLRAMADMNQDGIPDLLWQNDTTREVTVWFMGGPQGTVYMGQAEIGTTPGWTLRGAADMNQDGIPDLLWQNDTDRTVTVWFMSGPEGTVYNGQATIGQTPGWTLSATGDLNGDSVPDLLWQNDSSGEVTVWFMGGTQGTTYQSQTVVASTPGWTLRLAFDMNQDGIPDLLWQNASNGEATVWFMGGTQGVTYQSQATIGFTPGWSLGHE